MPNQGIELTNVTFAGKLKQLTIQENIRVALSSIKGSIAPDGTYLTHHCHWNYGFGWNIDCY
jgi:hypothetical protein